MNSSDIKNKDTVAAQLASAAFTSYAKTPTVQANAEALGPSWHAVHALAFFSYIRNALEDGKQIPQLPQDP